MRTETVTAENGVTVVVRNHTRRTPMIEKLYLDMLTEAYPEVQEVVDAARAVKSVKYLQSQNNSGNSTLVADPDDYRRYNDELDQLARNHPDANEEFLRMQEFVPLAARVISAHGTRYAPGANERFERTQLIKAFEEFMEEDDRDPLSLWVRIALAESAMDKPMTPKSQQPAEVLTATEKADPLSLSPISNGNANLTVISTKSR